VKTTNYQWKILKYYELKYLPMKNIENSIES
jgi:hypothetical protein